MEKGACLGRYFMLHSNWIQRRNKAKGRHCNSGSSPPSTVTWPLNDRAGFWHSCFHGLEFFYTPGPDSPAPACWVWWLYDLIIDADFLISSRKKTCCVTCKCSQALLGVLSKVFSAHTLEKRRGGNWQQLATMLGEVENEGAAIGSAMRTPSAAGMGGPGWHWCKL